MKANSKETTHPAYGIAAIHRVSGNAGNLFGSSVYCDHYVELEISSGVEIETGSYHGFLPAGKSHIRVVFSPAQFAELITSMNIGSGVPCTIKNIGGELIDRIPDELHVNELDRQKDNFKKRMKDLSKNLHNAQDRIKELLSLPRLTKEQKDELRNVLYKGIQDIDSNIPFYMEMFDEATENIVQEAKAEIDATVHNCVMNAGIKALGEEFNNNHKQLTEQ